jgi:general nucleoside transport system permease protein
MMLVGAATGFLVMDASGSAVQGALAAAAIGAALATLHAFLAVTVRANQILSGLALTIAGTGLAAIIGRSVVGVPAESTFADHSVPLLSSIPELGDIFFEHHALVYFGYVAAPIVWLIITRTRLGLHLRAVGENPAAADATGVSVAGYRYGAVVFGGAMAGLAGASLSLAQSPGWSEGITAGRGWIAVALVIFAMWGPLRLLAAAFLFGTLDVLAFRAQIIGVDVPATILGMIPYVGTILVLIGVTAFGLRQRLGAPEALGLPYARGER